MNPLKYSGMICDYCEKDFTGKGTNKWVLNNYYGITGCFCSNCYRLVAHDSYGNPENPSEYIYILLKMGYNNVK